MARAGFRFYAELNDFLPPTQRQTDCPVDFTAPLPVAHLIELFGVPHTEVEIILINGRSAALDTRVHDGDRVSVYPMFEALDVSPLLRLRERPLRRPRFVADAHLGRLARYLRLLGFDTLFENDPGDQALADISTAQRRILLTRDRGLLMRRQVTHGVYVRGTRALDQVAYVVRRCDLPGEIRPFTLCTLCNGRILPVPKDSVAASLPPAIVAHHQHFWRCQACGKVYWKGSHYARLRALVERFSRPTPGGAAERGD